MVFVLDTGTMGRNEQLLEAVFGTMKSRQGSDCHVATSPRRDVISKICTSSFKVRMAQKLGYREGTNRGTGFQSRVTRSVKFLAPLPGKGYNIDIE